MPTKDKPEKTRSRVIAGPILVILVILLAAIGGYFLFAGDGKSVPEIIARIVPTFSPSPTPSPEPPATEPPAPGSPAPGPSVPGSPASGPLVPETPVTGPPTPETLTPLPLPPPLPAEPPPPPARYPIEPEPLDEPLPKLVDSDTPFSNALGEAVGKKRLPPMLSEDLIYHLVATIDNLPRKHLPASIVPLKRAENVFVVEGKDDTLAIGARNARRYAVYAATAKAIDSARLVEIYRHFYPLFQHAYQEIGYPNAHFNDRLVVAIDDLLAAPEPKPPVRLRQPRVLFEYADPDLERRSAGQKIMMRVGPEHAAVLKAKLAEIRGLVTSQVTGSR
ncbi:MAG: DUF3014 domain-containing protein [Candidatus Accumulibacter sp.]|jgi:hypothetical protein|nr:DUF3014 domain-containing protein [Accumulibacter sp.]